MAKLIFVDANFLIPQTLRDVYNSDLKKTKGNNNLLTNNMTVNQNLIDGALADTKSLVELIKGIEDKNLSITSGVHKQCGMINNILENINEREQNYVFSKLNVSFSAEVCKGNDDRFKTLKGIREGMSLIKDVIDSNIYHKSNDILSNSIREYISGIKMFLEVSKVDHKFDYETDDSIIISAIYESLVKQNDVEVYTGDFDIKKTLSTAITTIERVKLLVDGIEGFDFMLKNRPKLYDHDKYSISEVASSNFDYCVGELRGDGDYFNKLTPFSRFVRNSINHLAEEMKNYKP